MTSPGHVHNITRSPRGEDMCTSCGEIVIQPILDHDDPRLHGAGQMRSPKPSVEYQDELPPLPILLITLYYDGPEYGYAKAPIAPYVETVALKEQAITGGIAEDFWHKLSER